MSAAVRSGGRQQTRAGAMRRCAMQTRRQVLGALSCAVAGAATSCSTGGARAARSASAPIVQAGAPRLAEYAAQPLAFDPEQLRGLSAKLLRSHHDNNYAGAVRKLNAVRGQLAQVKATTRGFVLRGLHQSEHAFKHSVVLHELYFGNLGGDGKRQGSTVEMLSAHYGGAGVWEERFLALGKSLGGGSGWAILEYDLHEARPRMYIAGDHTQGLSSGVPLLVLDMYEHSYHMDFGTAARRYIDAFFANLQWAQVDARLARALAMAKL